MEALSSPRRRISDKITCMFGIRTEKQENLPRPFPVDDVAAASMPLPTESLGDHVAKRFRRKLIFLPETERPVANDRLRYFGSVALPEQRRTLLAEIFSLPVPSARRCCRHRIQPAPSPHALSRYHLAGHRARLRTPLSRKCRIPAQPDGSTSGMPRTGRANLRYEPTEF